MARPSGSAPADVTLGKRLVFLGIVVALSLLLRELLCSAYVVHRHRRGGDLIGGPLDISPLSTVNLIYRAGVRRGLFDAPPPDVELKLESKPNPYLHLDPVLGYAPKAGEYIHTFSRRSTRRQQWQGIQTKVTINPDGSRWTGPTPSGDAPAIYIFGDSFVFGTGVNDEQTFSFLLQIGMPNHRVRLFAQGGYGLTQAYLNFNRLRDSMNPGDIVIIGYADWHDERHVVAPSFLRQSVVYHKKRNIEVPPVVMPKASLTTDGRIEITYVRQRCSENQGYCSTPDPTASEMTAIGAALINHIAANAPGKMYLLHFDGNPANPTFGLLRENVVRIPARAQDFDYFIRDDVEGFDEHPGPYWHYAQSRRLLETLMPRN
jgi:hypothetical protein